MQSMITVVGFTRGPLTSKLSKLRSYVNNDSPQGFKLEVFVRVDNVVVSNCKITVSFETTRYKITTRFLVVILWFWRYPPPPLPPLGGLTTTCVDKLVVILTTTVVVSLAPHTDNFQCFARAHWIARRTCWLNRTYAIIIVCPPTAKRRSIMPRYTMHTIAHSQYSLV